MRSYLATIVRGAAVAAWLSVAINTPCAALLKGWRDGPVASLLSPDAYRKFGELATDAERRTFIEDFWRTIGSDSAGSPDAFREVFHARCTAVDDRFRFGGQPGWRTDRGRVFLALGEPAAIWHQPGNVEAVDQEIWSYGGATGGATDSESSLRAVFYRCRDGQYRLDASCPAERDPTSVAYDSERAEFVRRIRDENPAAADGRVVAMLNGLLLAGSGGFPSSQQPSARSAAPPVPLGTAPSGGGGPGVHALENATYFFRARDGTVLTLLTVELLAGRATGGGVAQGTDPPYRGAAFVEETGHRGEDLPNTSAREIPLDVVPRAASDGRAAAFFGRVYLQPGRTYAVRYAVKDGARDEVFVRNDLVGVPELSHGFSVSSIVPAEEYGPANAEDGRFQVGSEEVVPKAGGLFRRSELLRLYLQVYDAARNPETLIPRVDVSFRFYRLIKGVSKRVGKPYSIRGATGASMGLALPIGDWPTGPYRVVVELHDRVSEARATAEGSFAIVDE